MPKLKINEDRKAVKHLLITRSQHSEIFRIAEILGLPVTHIVEQMIDTYKATWEVPDAKVRR